MEKCKCKSCNRKEIHKKIKIPKGYNWYQSDRKGNFIIIKFVEVYGK